mgnify:CR=1 FL=1
MAKQKPVPEQEEGAYTDTSEQISFQTREEAVEHFKKVRDRLLNISNWHQLCGMASANFQLTDPSGTAVDRPAQKGDHFRISIPGPGSTAGDGHDWVRIETIDAQTTPDHEWLAIKVHPASNPTNASHEAAHFFTPEATSTFMVLRKGNTISAEVHGRNEKSNNQETGIVDTIRNTLVAFGAMLGFSKIQWTQLVRGLISTDTD